MEIFRDLCISKEVNAPVQLMTAGEKSSLDLFIFLNCFFLPIIHDNSSDRASLVCKSVGEDPRAEKAKTRRRERIVYGCTDGCMHACVKERRTAGCGVEKGETRRSRTESRERSLLDRTEMEIIRRTGSLNKHTSARDLLYHPIDHIYVYIHIPLLYRI